MIEEDFATAWNEAANLDEVVARTGYNRFYASRLAARLRADGHEMRAFKRGPARKVGAGIEHKPQTARIGEFQVSEPLAVQIARAQAKVVAAKAELSLLQSAAAIEKAQYAEYRKRDDSVAVAAAVAQGGRLASR